MSEIQNEQQEKGFDVTDFKQKIDTVLKENERLQYIKKRYAELAVRLNEATASMSELIGEVRSVAAELDPMVRISVTSSSERNAKSRKMHDSIQSAYSLMQNGQQITREFIVKAFPELQQYDYGNIMSALKQMKDVKSIKDGHKLRLYI